MSTGGPGSPAPAPSRREEMAGDVERAFREGWRCARATDTSGWGSSATPSSGAWTRSATW